MENPVKGISLLYVIDDSVTYRTDCNCTSSNHQITYDVELDKETNEVAINISSVAISDSRISWWKRLSLTAKILVLGRYEVFTDTLYDKEVATNVCDAILRSMIELKQSSLQWPFKDYDGMMVVEGENGVIEVEYEEPDFVGIMIKPNGMDDPYVTYKKRLTMALSMMFNGYYEVDSYMTLNEFNSTKFMFLIRKHVERIENNDE